MSWRDGGNRAWFAPDTANWSLACATSLVAALAASLVLCAGTARAAGGDVDPAGYVTNGPVNALVHDDAEGSTYIGGEFSSVGPQMGSGLVLSDSGGGAPNPALFPQVAGGGVLAAASDGSGGWYIGGNFDFVDAELHPWLAHINSDGSVDSGWTPTADGSVRALAVSGSTVYVGGDFATIDGQNRGRIAALDAATGNVTSWNPNADGNIRALDVSGGTVYAGGEFTTIGGQSRSYIAALDGSGNATSWNPSANNFVSALAVSGSDVYAGGAFSGSNSIGGEDRDRIAALDVTAGIASGWDPDANGTVSALAVSGSVVYAGGSFGGSGSIGGQDRDHIAALDATTGVASSWNPGADAAVQALAVSGATVYAGGDFSMIGGELRGHVAALDEGTGAASGWDPNTDGSVHALAAAGTDVYVGGDFASAGPNLATRSNIARMNADGTLDTTWNPGADGRVSALALSGNRLFVGGDFTTLAGQSRSGLGALDADTGAMVGGWAPSVVAGDVLALAVSGGTLYAGGNFLSLGSVGPYIGSVEAATGDVVGGWNPSPNSGPVRALAASAGTVYVGGAFGQIGGQPRANLAALDAVSGTATSWDPGAAFIGPEVLALSGGTVYAGGGFFSIGHMLRNNIASLDPSDPNSDATAWNPDASSTLKALVVSNGVVYAGGAFVTIGGQSRNGLAALNPTTGLATGWNPDAAGVVSALAVSEDTAYVGGSFNRVGGLPAAHFAQIDAGVSDLSASPSSKSFGSQLIGTSSGVQSFTVTNTGAADVDVSAVSLAGAGAAHYLKSNDQCVGETLNPSETCTVEAAFSPTSAGSKNATLRLTQAVGGSTNVPLSGTGIAPVFSASPASDFGDQSVAGTSAPQTITVTNIGSADLHISTATVAGADAAQFVESNDQCAGATVAPGLSCTVDVAFSPTSVGAKNASLQFNDDAAGSPHDVSLSGTGTAPGFSVDPVSNDFGDQLVASSSAAQTFTVTNSGTASLNISNAAVTGLNADQFVESSDQCSGVAVAPSDTCTVEIEFHPTSGGPKDAILRFTDDAAGSPHDVSLDGNGTTAPDSSLTPPSHNFGSRQVSTGPSAPQLFTVLNTGTADVVISSVSLTGADAGQFLIGANTCDSATVTPSSTCTINVAFVPSTEGAKAASLRVADNSAGSPRTSALAGNGTVPATTPTGPGPVAPTPTPTLVDTTIMKGPKKTTTKKDATFQFASPVAGSRFECKLDKKAFARCVSPMKLKRLKPGKHIFQVRAVDGRGNADSSPASFSWKVQKKK